MTLAQVLALWDDELRDISAMGTHFAHDIYDRETYHRIRNIALAMLALATGKSLAELEPLREVSLPRPTPLATGDGAIINERGEILLSRRADSGQWAMPGGSLTVGAWRWLAGYGRASRQPISTEQEGTLNNSYSSAWFELFLQRIAPAQSAAEVAFLGRCLPQPAYGTVLDICCGEGRHAALLAKHGYKVTGMDRDARALATARRQAEADGLDTVRYIEGDMRRLAEIPGQWDGVVNLWQSFGSHDEATNREVLRQMGAKLRPGGRLVLDVYQRGFFEANQGEQQFVCDGRLITERKQMAGNRLTAQLDYGQGCGSDSFEWQLYEPAELERLAAGLGLDCLICCTGFDEKNPPSINSPRVQYLSEKGSAP